MILRGLLALLLLVGSSALAASYQHSVLQIAVSSGATFTGPGDIVSGATAWYGLRGYSAAVAATGTQKAINVRRQSDNVACDVLIATSGDLGLTSATCNSSTQGGITPSAFAGTDATCQGTIASTTLTCSSASSTPVANDTVSGGGIVGPSYIVSCGTFTAGAGTCTLNAAQTVSVAETVTMQVALFVTEAYDQSGNTVNITQAAAGTQPQLLPLCLNSLACLSFVGASSQNLSGGAIGASAQPWSFMGVAQAPTNSGEQQIIGTSGTFNPRMSYQTNLFGGYAGAGPPTATATSGVWHAVSFVANGASSILVVDGVATTGVNSGVDALTARGSNILWGGSSPNFTGSSSEIGAWPLGFSSPQYGNLCHNQFLYYSTATSC